MTIQGVLKYSSACMIFSIIMDVGDKYRKYRQMPLKNAPSKGARKKAPARRHATVDLLGNKGSSKNSTDDKSTLGQFYTKQKEFTSSGNAVYGRFLRQSFAQIPKGGNFVNAYKDKHRHAEGCKAKFDPASLLHHILDSREKERRNKVCPYEGEFERRYIDIFNENNQCKHQAESWDISSRRPISADMKKPNCSSEPFKFSVGNLEIQPCRTNSLSPPLKPNSEGLSDKKSPASKATKYPLRRVSEHRTNRNGNSGKSNDVRAKRGLELTNCIAHVRPCNKRNDTDMSQVVWASKPTDNAPASNLRDGKRYDVDANATVSNRENDLEKKSILKHTCCLSSKKKDDNELFWSRHFSSPVLNANWSFGNKNLEHGATLIPKHERRCYYCHGQNIPSRPKRNFVYGFRSRTGIGKDDIYQNIEQCERCHVPDEKASHKCHRSIVRVQDNCETIPLKVSVSLVIFRLFVSLLSRIQGQYASID